MKSAQRVHPANSEHKPGYTVPYSPPEIFKNESQIFLAKSDVFSLGVIMFEMIYGSYPYDIFETTERVDEIMRGYLKKWYFTPEEYETYGDVNVLRILNGLISRCLASDPVHRPELDWIALVVRQCFDLLQ
jgi:serine/threonine protein kinase